MKEEELFNKLKFLQNATGGVLGPFDSFLLLQGIKTLGVRMDRHNQNAQAIADYLSNNQYVLKVYYPGDLKSKGYAIQKKQAEGFGGMLSFTTQDNIDYRVFLKSLKIVTLAESLGGVESLICHPASMTHASIPDEIRKNAGITDNLLRLSVGIESLDDLIDDLEQAFLKSIIKE